MIDLRTDTVTRPTEAMLESMREATLGDDSRDGDETVGSLESLAAALMGKEAGAFMPSGTMTNLVAVLTHTQRGGEVLLESGSHILSSELGGITAVAGAFYKGIPGKRGAMDIDTLKEAIRPATRNNFGTALVCMETTHNRAGGSVLPVAHMQSVYDLAAENGVPVHTDGARIFNAAVALGVEAKAIARHTDSVGFCVSKGLSAPVGSLLCGEADFVTRARHFRKMLGGGMRQAGVIAAAGIVALEQMVDRLADDHRAARGLAEALAGLSGLRIDASRVQSNMVRIDLEHRDARPLAATLARRGVRVSTPGPRRLRIVTHRHVTSEDIPLVVDAFRWALDQSA